MLGAGRRIDSIFISSLNKKAAHFLLGCTDSADMPCMPCNCSDSSVYAMPFRQPPVLYRNCWLIPIGFRH